jgi:hypothetical protein
MNKTEKFGIFQLNLKTSGAVTFEKNGERFAVHSFLSGESEYTARFMPWDEGVWTYSAAGLEGAFECVAAREGNHGPVRAKGFTFQYADGSRFIPFGTTCYAWTHQPRPLCAQTLKTLAASPFNKVRMCVFPKHMPYNHNEPDRFPFRKDAEGKWDVTKPDFQFWEDFEGYLRELEQLGIEADLILFHPYDRWGFATLSREENLTYLAYCVNRLSAFHHLWWSLANEYDFVFNKTQDDWDAFGEFVSRGDIYGHLLSVHNGFTLYPKRDWMTHVSAQTATPEYAVIWRGKYNMPVMIDECKYEGDIEFDWGNITGFEMVHRFWLTVARGGFCTHGETYHRDDEVLWWAKGGALYGESPKRLAFLKEILCELPEIMEPEPLTGKARDPAPGEAESMASVFERELAKQLNALPEGEREHMLAGLLPLEISSPNSRLYYLGRSRGRWRRVTLPQNGAYSVEVIDIWEMTRTLCLEEARGEIKVPLPAKEGMAILAKRL